MLTGLQAQLASVEGLIDRAKEQQKQLESSRQEQERLGALFSDPIESNPAQPATGAATDNTVPPSNTLEGQLAIKRAQLAQMGMRLRPGHPDYDAMDREVRDLEQKVAAADAARKIAAAVAATPLTPLGAQATTTAATAGAKPGTDASVLPIDLVADAIRIQSEGLKIEVAKHERGRAKILKQIKAAQGKLNLTPAIEQELMALIRDREVLQRRDDDLQSKKFNSQMATSLANDINNETYKIIDEANLPERPSVPDRMRIVMLGLGGAFLLSLGAVAGREYLDPTLGSEHEAASVLHLPILVCIPEIQIQSRARRRLLAKKAS